MVTLYVKAAVVYVFSDICHGIISNLYAFPRNFCQSLLFVSSSEASSHSFAAVIPNSVFPSLQALADMCNGNLIFSPFSRPLLSLSVVSVERTQQQGNEQVEHLKIVKVGDNIANRKDTSETLKLAFINHYNEMIYYHAGILL